MAVAAGMQSPLAAATPPLDSPLRVVPGFEYRYAYEATATLHESDALVTDAKLAVIPLQTVAGTADDKADVVCALEVRHFNQRSQTMNLHDATYIIGTNDHDYSRWFSFS